jgi:hypothetical protein
MNVDAAGVTHEQNAALNRLTSSANAPTFSFLDVFFGDGLLGGSMQSVKEGSELAAAVALRVLGGEKAGDIKTPPYRKRIAEIRWAANAALEHQRKPPATGERSLVSGANGMAALFVANRAHYRTCSIANRTYHGPAA